jgi:hypothetical protein
MAQSPFGSSGAGANAFKAAYDRLKAEADLTKKNTAQTFGSAYQQLRQQGYGMGLGAAAQTGLSGGQAQGVKQQIGAQQMNALSGLAQGREKAEREAKVGEQSIYSNALIEGQQAQDMENNRLTQVNAILKDAKGNLKDPEDFTEIEKQQLVSLGYVENAADLTYTDTSGAYRSEEGAKQNAPGQGTFYLIKQANGSFKWVEASGYGLQIPRNYGVSNNGTVTTNSNSR